jgi:hypothetical protein
MATGKKHATARAATSVGRDAVGPAPRARSQQAVRTYRVVVIKDGIFVGGGQRRHKGLAS